MLTALKGSQLILIQCYYSRRLEMLSAPYPTWRLLCRNDDNTKNHTKFNTFPSFWRHMFSKLCEIARRNSSMGIDFDNRDALSEADFTNLTGLGKQNFNDLHHHISDTIRNTPTRSTRVSLGIFLLKLKSGMSNKLLLSLFKINKWSLRRSVQAWAMH